MTEYVLVVAGLGGLILGAELLVRSGTAIAARLGISPLLIGLTVVSIGTSLPELAIGIDATLNDAGPLAVGNIAGTNMVNILLILGLSAAMLPLALGRQTLRLDLPVMAVSAVLLLVLCFNGTLSRFDGVLLLAVAIGYTVAAVRGELTSRTPSTTDDTPDQGPMWQRSAQLIAGIVIVVIAADWLVDGSVRVATDLGISEALIGLTVIAIGTSAPEFVTTVVSTIRGDRDLAIGNLIGSSVYNITFILGTAALVRPLAITDDLIHVDIPLMTGVALLCIPVFITGRRVSRLEGIAFVATYLVYLTLVIALRT
ncbi:calcium/sodium antiporter [Gordonia sp. ABSL49_1]|uniref:calcium/sodium antiporter n=1 Tax=unclassified Gordonia (in: high G+C Gram-positive bacteria) TaxID=2657482 RepID=UPI001F0CF0C2|nr:calcium/sodium antiporter [Gordonia sp. ABSL49_1]MCH5641794.1 calcium/sodium antiporter [Gordonia sp. ABSL49_1]